MSKADLLTNRSNQPSYKACLSANSNFNLPVAQAKEGGITLDFYPSFTASISSIMKYG